MSCARHTLTSDQTSIRRAGTLARLVTPPIRLRDTERVVGGRLGSAAEPLVLRAWSQHARRAAGLVSPGSQDPRTAGDGRDPGPREAGEAGGVDGVIESLLGDA